MLIKTDSPVIRIKQVSLSVQVSKQSIPPIPAKTYFRRALIRLSETGEIPRYDAI
jgi:hypothetical protein